MEDTVTKMILDELRDIKADINQLSMKLDESTKDRATFKEQILVLQTRVSQIELQVAAINKPYTTQATRSVWNSIPRLIIQWIIPLLLAAIMYAFMNGFGKEVL